MMYQRKLCIQPKVGKESRTSHLEVKIELSQKQHKGVELLLDLQVSFNSYILLFKLCSTSTCENIYLYLI